MLAGGEKCLHSCDPHMPCLGPVRPHTDISICFALKELLGFYEFPLCTPATCELVSVSMILWAECQGK